MVPVPSAGWSRAAREEADKGGSISRRDRLEKSPLVRRGGWATTTPRRVSDHQRSSPAQAQAAHATDIDLVLLAGFRGSLVDRVDDALAVDGQAASGSADAEC